jgi:hypothetical protein
MEKQEFTQMMKAMLAEMREDLKADREERKADRKADQAKADENQAKSDAARKADRGDVGRNKCRPRGKESRQKSP